jgi:hypothetical protein
MKIILTYIIFLIFILQTECYAQQDTLIMKDTIETDYYYFFNSNPFNANVLYKDSLIGITPLRFYSSEKLGGNIVFKKTDFKDLTFDLKNYNFEKGIEVNLDKIYNFNLVEKDRLSQFKTKRNYGLIIGTGLVTLLGGFSAVQFKNIANNSYDNYQITLNNSELDKSNKYDIYSGIGLAVMQIAFIGFIYFLFFK